MIERRTWSERSGSKLTYRRVVSFSKILYSPKVLVIHRKRWLCPNMTEKIVDWDVKPQHKQTNKIRVSIMGVAVVSCKLGDTSVS